MGRQVVVMWDGEPIGVVAVGARAVRVGPDVDDDVVLPVSPRVIASDGETVIDDRFAVHVATATDDDQLLRVPFRVGRGVAFAALSALLHAAVFASIAVSIRLVPSDPGADDATRLAAMRGYLARTAAADGADEPAPRTLYVAAEDADTVATPTPTTTPTPAPTPTPTATPTWKPWPALAPRVGPRRLAARSATTRAAAASGRASITRGESEGSEGKGASGARGTASGASLRAGDDWAGTYVCAQGRTDLVLRVVAVDGGEHVRAVFDFTHAPTGVHGAYRMHGNVDERTGEATLVPDDWIERPPSYVTVGMHGRFDGPIFRGVITNPSCGAFSLHRPSS